MRKFLLIGVTSGLLFAVACGGGSSSSTTTSSKAAVAECIQFLDNSYLWGSVRLADVRMGGTALGGTAVNVAPLAVDAGPAPSNPQTNVAFTTVEVCAPGTTNCVTIDDVAVDTGSTGFEDSGVAALITQFAKRLLELDPVPYGRNKQRQRIGKFGANIGHW